MGSGVVRFRRGLGLRNSGFVLVVLATGCPHSGGPTNVRTSRPGAGTIVGITVRSGTPVAAVNDAFAALDRYEGELSEWNPGSKTSLACGGQSQWLDVRSVELFTVATDLRQRTKGAFNLAWRGGGYTLVADMLSTDPGTKLDLGGVLKGFLADRAADALRAAKVANFAVDAGGDIVVGGTEEPGGWGWPVTVVVGGKTQIVHVTGALSTSSQEQQPGHIRDARTGEASSTLAGVFVEAPSGLLADSVATALMAWGGFFDLPEAACGTVIEMSGRQGGQCGSSPPMWRSWD